MPERLIGIDERRVSAWFADHVPAVVPPLEFRLISGGRSNLTFTVADAEGHRWVLRRPPVGPLLPTAHDVAREHRVLSGLGPTPVCVPATIGLCVDDDVNGAPFYVMEFVDGLVLRDEEDAQSYDGERRHAVGLEMADVLARIHAVDLDETGLVEIGRSDGYVERQLRRWRHQWERTKRREVPVIDDVHQRLAGAIPAQAHATLVHGDYRLDNSVLDPGGSVAAVLDWELCTIGDPLADLGLLLVYWSEPGDETIPIPGAPTLAGGFPSRQEMVERYAGSSGRDVSGIEYFFALGYWKLACIMEGVRVRYLEGAMGAAPRADEGLDGRVVALAEAARALLTAAGR